LKTLEIEPLQGKTLRVMLIEKEYNELLSTIEDAPAKNPSQILDRTSIIFCKFLEDLALKYKPDFATEELGIRSDKDFYENNVVATLFEKLKIPFHPVDINEHAKSYLAATLDEKKESINEVLNEWDRLSTAEQTEETKAKSDYLVAYGQYLQQELEAEKRKISSSIREKWIVSGILENAKTLNKRDVLCLHICSPRHVNGVTDLLNKLDVEDVLTIKPEKKIISDDKERGESKNLLKLMETLEIQAVPVVKEATSRRLPYILFFLDVDDYASPFDICMAYDAGFDVVVPYENVTADRVKDIVQDAIFSRGPKGVARTSFLIGGSDLQKAKEALAITKKSMFPPFEVSVVIDPQGAYTTAAAMVAEVEHGAEQIGLGSLQDRKAVILAGTGPVGKAAAVLCARLGCETYVTSRKKQKADETAKEISEEGKVTVKGLQAATPEETYQAIKDADIILATGTEGITLVPQNVLQRLEGKKIAADVNAVPPTGIEGLKPKGKLKEIAPDIFGIGALAVGNTKYLVERKILTDARKAEKASSTMIMPSKKLEKS